MRKRRGSATQQAVISLGDWFARNARAMPWRDRPEPYRVWISEIMLQQTQVATVIPYFERFLTRFPGVGELAAAPEADVLGLWAGLGYYSRARNLQAAARAVVAAGGRFPETVEGWRELPGVGPYTAGAVVSIAFDRAVPIVDGNVERVAARLMAWPRDARFAKRVWRLAARAVRAAVRAGVRPRAFNQALMELGATVCAPRAPLCGICALAPLCRARARGEIDRFPTPKPPKAWIDVEETRDVWLDAEGRTWLTPAPAAGDRGWRRGLWDFPEPGAAGPGGGGGEPLGEIEVRYVVTRHRVRRVCRVYRARVGWSAAEPACGEPTGAWVRLDDDESARPPVGAPVLKGWRRLRERFPRP